MKLTDSFYEKDEWEIVQTLSSATNNIDSVTFLVNYGQEDENYLTLDKAGISQLMGYLEATLSTINARKEK